MTQKEFEKLSFEECKSLNGEQETKAVLEAWRFEKQYLQTLGQMERQGLIKVELYKDGSARVLNNCKKCCDI